MEEAENGAREQRSPPPPGIPKWLIFDLIVHRSRRRRCGVVEDDATATALALDCVGRPVRASLRIADPPGVSRLYLHLTGRPELPRCREPVAIAAHRNSILFRMTVPFEDPDWWSCAAYFPEDYSCSEKSSSPPTLTLLPPCFHGGEVDPKFDKFFQPHPKQQQRVMLDQRMGILRHGDHGEFTVADLTQRNVHATTSTSACYTIRLLPLPFQCCGLLRS